MFFLFFFFVVKYILQQPWESLSLTQESLSRIIWVWTKGQWSAWFYSNKDSRSKSCQVQTSMQSFSLRLLGGHENGPTRKTYGIETDNWSVKLTLYILPVLSHRIPTKLLACGISFPFFFLTISTIILQLPNVLDQYQLEPTNLLSLFKHKTQSTSKQRNSTKKAQC